MKYSDDWANIVGRLGRWIDMENNYKTMDTSFMESVWCEESCRCCSVFIHSSRQVGLW